MARKKPTPKQRKSLLEKNAKRCCVCKQSGVGFELHHIDGDNSNTIEENLALLCASDHDNHHRPGTYTNKLYCKDLRPEVILRFKQNWEAFVKEASKENPETLATLNFFGNEELIHSAKLIMQHKDGSVEYERVFHLHYGKPEDWIDEILEEVTDIGKNVKLILVESPLEVEHCPCSNRSYSQTIDECMATKITSPDWQEKSIVSIYINPLQPSLAINISYGEETIFTATLHKCNGRFIHLESDGPSERIKIKIRPSIRSQVTEVVQSLLDTWEPAHILIGTGDPDEPEMIDDFQLPRIWEKAANKSADAASCAGV